MIIVKSAQNVPVRVTHERLNHIYAHHPEMQGYAGIIMDAIGEPDFVQEGDFGAKIGLKRMPGENPSKYIAVIYKEVTLDDGFLLTAYFTRKPASWRTTIWKR